MDLEPHSEPSINFTTASTTNTAEPTAYTGAFLPYATGFTVGGGVFTCNIPSNLYNLLPQQPSELPRIRPNDPYGRDTGAFFPHASGFTINGGVFTCNVTNNVYNLGQQTFEFRRIPPGDIRLVKNMVQYGILGRKGRDAGVRRLYSARIRLDPAPVTVAMYQGHAAEETTEFNEATNYLSGIFQEPLTLKDYDDLPVWIRPATGEVCLDLVQEHIPLDHPDAENMVICNLDEDKYHELCSMPSIAQYRTFSVPAHLSIRRAPMILRADSKQQILFKIPEAYDLGPVHWRDYEDRKGEILPNFWTRYDSQQACNLRAEFLVLSWSESSKFWMAQANHIFTLFQTTSHFEDYVFLDMVSFILRCIPNPFHTPEKKGYLFWPSCPAYWSLDPSGAARLSPEDAKILGFSAIHIETVVRGGSWDSNVYKGLRNFHRGKGFDSESQDIATCLDYPRFEFVDEGPAPLTYTEVEGWCHLEDPLICQALHHYCD
ncbi:hypothetical protein MSAN_00575600 [Mycena sanguinolenta]|uniref:Uncharacterized protein n=1 Tax=Mycena sanguinolenta TaxID=230812 RepID=A0A8H6Z9X3_9AGAR|nr:hypothetical protein MSAN_00575600 [Mycena sanguinolenta]